MEQPQAARRPQTPAGRQFSLATLILGVVAAGLLGMVLVAQWELARKSAENAQLMEERELLRHQNRMQAEQLKEIQAHLKEIGSRVEQWEKQVGTLEPLKVEKPSHGQ